MPGDAFWGICLSAVGIIAMVVQKCRCYLRQRTDEDGDRMPTEWAVGFTERPLVPRTVEEQAAIRQRHSSDT